MKLQRDGMSGGEKDGEGFEKEHRPPLSSLLHTPSRPPLSSLLHTPYRPMACYHLLPTPCSATDLQSCGCHMHSNDFNNTETNFSKNIFQSVLSNSILQKLSNCSNFFSVLANRIDKFTVNFSACYTIY